jgi:hypothetical protein
VEEDPVSNGTETPSGAADATRPPTVEAADDPATARSDSGWVTTDVAATALRRSPRRVREYIRRGMLEARTEGEGVNKRWLVSIDSLNEMLDETGQGRGTRTDVRPASAQRPGRYRGGRTSDAAVVDADDLIDTVQELQYRLGRAEARAELTAQAESTLREALERERERADRLEAELLEMMRKRPPEAQEAEGSASANVGEDIVASPEQAKLPRRRSWLYRFFFGQ